MSQIIKGVTAGSLPPVVATSYLLDDGNSAVPAANVIIVHGATGADTSLGASNEIVINVVSDGFDWSEETADFTADIQSGYFCNNALTATLPAAKPDASILTIGNTVIIYVDTEDQVIIQASPGQSIQVGDTVSSAGGTATCTAGQKGSILELIFKPSDLTWHTQSSIGTFITA